MNNFTATFLTRYREDRQKLEGMRKASHESQRIAFKVMGAGFGILIGFLFIIILASSIF